MSVAMSIQFSQEVSERDVEEVSIAETPSVYGSAYSVSSLAIGGRYALLPLDRNKDDIRLLQLLPGKLSDPIVCKLYLTSRKDGPIYTALSYTWGDPMNVTSITVNDRDWLVTENLFAALHDVRNEREPMTLWIDAICIDQKNEPEKSWHVQQMRQTFAEASEALVYLGRSAEGDPALPMLQRIGEAASSLGSEDEIWGDDNHSRVVALYEKNTKSDEPDPTSAKESDPLDWLFKDLIVRNEAGLHFPEPATHNLFSVPWFGRTWCLQELAVSNSVQFLYGRARIERLTFTIAAQLYYQYKMSVWAGHQGVATESPITDDQKTPGLEDFPIFGEKEPEIQKRVIDMCNTTEDKMQQRVYTQFTIRWAFLNYAKTTGLPFGFLLSNIFTYGGTRVLRASDPRDYVYGLMGLATDSEQLGLQADYTKTADAAFTELARALIEHGYLIVLSWCRSQHGRGILPSWAPNFAHKTQRPLQWIVRSHEKDEFVIEPKFEASKGLIAPPGGHGLEPPLPRSLHLPGVHIDTIEYSGVSFEELFERSIPQAKLIVRTCIRWLKELKTFLSDSPNGNRYDNITQQSEAIWRTSVADIEMSPSWEKFRMSENSEMIELHKALFQADFPYDRMMDDERLQNHFHLMDMVNVVRRPWVSSKGYLGLGPAELRPGDRVVIFCGAQMPHVLRTAYGRTTLVGDTYVHGLMDGEAAQTPRQMVKFELS